jgi:hypothetical protein
MEKKVPVVPVPVHIFWVMFKGMIFAGGGGILYMVFNAVPEYRIMHLSKLIPTEPARRNRRLYHMSLSNDYLQL